MSIENGLGEPNENPPLSRSAAACPPRFASLHEKRPKPRGHGRLLSRPAHGEGQALALRAMRRCPIFLP